MAPVSRTSRVLAGVAGFVAAFLFVMLATALSPQGQPESGTVELRYDDFAFERESIETTQGSLLRLVNAGQVPATFQVQDPVGGNATLRLDPGAQRNLTLDAEGTYAVSVVTYDWSEAEVVVRTPNPFERFFEDLF